MSETLYLIDGHAQIFRAYYAIRGGMRSPHTSEPTHAIFGFTGMLLKLFSQFRPHYVVVAIDTPGKTFRDELYADYKATREATPDDLTSQVPRILEVVELFGIPVIGVPGLEADDIIATITERILADTAAADVQIRIVSKDKDLEQLLGERVTMFDIHTDTTIDVASLKANKGITPQQVIDVLALMGDSSDNIPGVPGIGPKTAAQLIGEFASIDGILANLDRIKGKKRENIEAARQLLPLSRTLVTLKRDAEFPFSLDAARVRPLNVQKIIPLFQLLGFNRYQDDVRRLAESTPDAAATAKPATQSTTLELPFGQERSGSDRGAATESPPPSRTRPARCTKSEAAGTYEAVTTPADLEKLVTTLRAQQLLAVDTETTGLGRNSELCGLSFAWKRGHGAYVPVRSPNPGMHLDTATVVTALKPVLEDPGVAKCGHNLKFDARVLLSNGIHLRGIIFDSMLSSTLIDPTQPAHKLDYLALSQLHYQMIPIAELIGSDEGQTSMDRVPLEKIARYAAEDADISLRLYHHLAPRLEALGMAALMRDCEAPLTAVIAEMEINGIRCDPDELMRQGEQLGSRVKELQEEIKRVAGCDFDLNSTRQTAEILYDKLGLASGRKTQKKTARSTDITELERLAAQEDRNDPRTSMPRLLIEYRQLTKLISTYLGSLRSCIDRNTGRIHSTFHQLYTATGRLASHGPNLQNIPVRTDVGRQVRKAFIAPEGYRLICADYSQIELRVLAHLSEDEALIDAFQRDQDIHASVAAQVFGAPLKDVTREQRNHAKTINFGIIYGVTPFGLARRIEGLDVESATRLIADYKRRFPGIDQFLQRCVTHALEFGYVSTLLGRRRAIPEIRSRNRNKQSLGERLAINSVVQGSAADLIKLAMVKVHQRIDRDHLPLKLLLQIHDELIYETPAPLAEEHAGIVMEEMQHAMSLRVPLRCSAGIGQDWLSAK